MVHLVIRLSQFVVESDRCSFRRAIRNSAFSKLYKSFDNFLILSSICAHSIIRFYVVEGYVTIYFTKLNIRSIIFLDNKRMRAELLDFSSWWQLKITILICFIETSSAVFINNYLCVCVQRDGKAFICG